MRTMRDDRDDDLEVDGGWRTLFGQVAVIVVLAAIIQVRAGVPVCDLLHDPRLLWPF